MNNLSVMFLKRIIFLQSDDEASTPNFCLSEQDKGQIAGKALFSWIQALLNVTQSFPYYQEISDKFLTFPPCANSAEFFFFSSVQNLTPFIYICFETY